MAKSRSFTFDGGAGTYLGTLILQFLVTLFTFGIAYPYALVLRQRWKAKHTYINGVPLVFIGTGIGLFAQWLKWLLLMIITLGIYSFWVVPRVNRWVTEHTDFDPLAPLPPTFTVGGTTYGPIGPSAGFRPPTGPGIPAGPPSPAFMPPPQPLT